MAAKSSTLVVKVISDASQAQKELAATADRIEGFQKKAAAAAVGFFAVDKVMSGVKSVVSAASDLEQAVGGTDAVFKSSASEVHKWAADTSDAVRLPQAAYEQLATIIGAQLKNAGVSMGELAPKTKDLMQLGADLAATFGTDVASAVGAISAALKGERDPIERYGVSLKQAAVNAKALELAQGDQAKAATQAMQSQATLALIYEQTADAQGGAAREAESFQARLDSFKEKATNLAAVVGGPLLVGFGQLLDSLSSLAPVIEPIGVAISNFISAIAQLPAPVLGVVAGLAALAFIGPQVVGAFANMAAGVSSMLFSLGKMAAFFTTPWGLALAAGLLIAGAAIVAFTANARAAEEQLKTTQTGAEGFLRVLKQWGSGSQLRSEGMSQMTDAFKELGVTVPQVAGQIGVAVPKMITGIMGDARTGGEVIDAFNAKIAALNKQKVQVSGGRFAMTEVDPEAQKQIAILEQARDKYQALISSMPEARKAFDEYNKSVAAGTATTEEMTQAAGDLKENLKQMQAAAKMQFEFGEGNLALQAISESADRAKRSAAIFNAEMDISLGRNRAFQETTIATSAALADIGDAFKAAADAGQLNKDALLNWDIGALADAGDKSRDLASGLLDLSSQFGTFVTQSFEAAGGAQHLDQAIGAAHVAADTFRGKFVGMHDAMGMTEEEAGQLADQLGILDSSKIDDKVFQIIADDQKAAVTAKLWESVKLDEKTMTFVAEVPAAQDLADLMNGVVSGVVPNPVDLPAEVTGAAQAGAQASAEAGTAAAANPAQVPVTAPGGAAAGAEAGAAASAAAAANPAEVPVTAETGNAQQQISAVGDGIRDVAIEVGANTTIAQQAITALTTQQRTLTILVAANAAGAASTIQGVVSGNYSTTVQVKGDNNAAIASIRSVTTGNYTAIVRVDGDNSGAISAIRSVTTGYYSATVRITADASGFWAVWNALPTSKTITITTQQQTVNLPPAPAPGLLASGPAPSLRATAPRATGPTQLTRSGAGGEGIVINVNGALDPDAVARQIRRIVVGRDRRAGGVVIDAMRPRAGA